MQMYKWKISEVMEKPREKDHVRLATNADIHELRRLILESFLAMVEFQGESARSRLERYAGISMDEDLTYENFGHSYVDSGLNRFWVAESTPGEPLSGSVAVKRLNTAEAELVRMSVDPNLRGKGVGTQLLKVVDEFCTNLKVQRLHITTGNPRAKDFYIGKFGATLISTRDFHLDDGSSVKVFRMIKYYSEKLIRKVAVVGGTHGNERLGVELIRQWVRDDSSLQRPSFETIPIMGNPEAVLHYRRFIDEDLNRQFTGWMRDKPEKNALEPREKFRAHELNELLGPKDASWDEKTGVDFIVDLHSSTSHTGLVAMISGIEHDAFAKRLCYFLQQEIPDLRVCSSTGGKDASYSLDSVAPSGVSFEVGPLCHGLLNNDLLLKTRNLVARTLDFIEIHNSNLLSPIETALSQSAIDGKDFHLSSLASTTLYPQAVIPRHFPTITYFIRVGDVKFPLSSVLVNSNSQLFAMDKECPLDCLQECKQYILHPQWEGKDWAVIKDGDPLFTSADDIATVYSFQSSEHLFSGIAQNPEAPFELYTLFINEAAYAPRNIAMTLYKKVDDVVF